MSARWLTLTKEKCPVCGEKVESIQIDRYAKCRDCYKKERGT